MSDEIVRCTNCGAEVAPGMLACPTCRRLVHSDRLKDLARKAETAHGAGDPTAALAHWREALTLLPAGTTQYEAITAKMAALRAEVDKGAPATPPGSRDGTKDGTKKAAG